MTDALLELMLSHADAARAFREALFSDGEDSAFEGESLAMMALLSHPPATIEQARRRARYLMLTRFPDALDAEGLANLQSFTKGEEQALTER